MTTGRRPRDRQRGNSLLLALIVMSVLATLGSLTVISVQSSLKTSTNDRSETIARYAAESGAAVAMDYLRGQIKITQATTDWSAYFTVNNAEPRPPLPFPSNGAQPGTPNNLLSPDQNAWYLVEALNNRNDPGFQPTLNRNDDTDGQIILRATGHGPQGSVAIIEWEVRWQSQPPSEPLILMGWRVVL
jgi:type II secretory pathway pseudopilin PulG